MQHLGPRRAHPRALAGGENDCQTCADLKMKGDHKTPLLYARRSLARIADRNAYSHKFEKLLARNLAGPLREFKQASAFSRHKRVSHRSRKSRVRKNTSKGTYVRPVIVYRDKTKAFSECAARSGAGQAEFMVERREVLKFVLGGMAGKIAARAGVGSPANVATPSTAQEAPPGFAWGEPSPFDPNMVTDAARTLSKQPSIPLSADIPAVFRNLGYEQYAAIRQRPGTAIWAPDNPGFAIEPLHRGFIFSTPMEINLVAEGKARRVIYDPVLFDFGKLAVPKNLGDIGFSGFRVLAQGQDGFSALAIFQGASFFRAVAPGQTLGTMARAMSIKTADPRGEEFPAFRTVWIERPTRAAGALAMHALIGSESVTGAYHFTLRPGEATIIDTECALFARGVVDNLGLATICTFHLSGPIDERRSDDLRPSVSEVTGLQILTGKGEWLWRPVTNRDTLQISTFVDENPRGFGFLQRDRNFDHYQDDDQ